MVRVPVVRRGRSPWADVDRFARDMEGLFTGLTGTQDLWTPPVDVSETADHLVFRAELPGVTRDAIDIELEDGVLTIQGEKIEERQEEDSQGLLRERRWGTFTRRFTLPRAVDANNITAMFTDGILTVRIPKAEEAKGRKIEITDGQPEGRDVSES